MECSVDTGNGKVVTKKLPMFDPHRILQYLVDTVGLHIDYAQIDQYWSHLEALDCKWAKRVGDHKLIPCLVLHVIFLIFPYIKIIYIYI